MTTCRSRSSTGARDALRCSSAALATPAPVVALRGDTLARAAGPTVTIARGAEPIEVARFDVAAPVDTLTIAPDERALIVRGAFLDAKGTEASAARVSDRRFVSRVAACVGFGRGGDHFTR